MIAQASFLVAAESMKLVLTGFSSSLLRTLTCHTHHFRSDVFLCTHSSISAIVNLGRVPKYVGFGKSPDLSCYKTTLGDDNAIAFLQMVNRPLGREQTVQIFLGK